MRKTIAVVSLAAVLSLAPVAATSAGAHEVTAVDAAVVVQPTPTPVPDNGDEGGNKGNNGLWGLLGLLGLSGLLGLIPRKPKVKQPGYSSHVSDAARSEARDNRGDIPRDPNRGDIPRDPGR